MLERGQPRHILVQDVVLTLVGGQYPQCDDGGVQARGSRPTRDSGYYSRYAGPVRVVAGHRCVRVSGSEGGSSAHSGWIC